MNREQENFEACFKSLQEAGLFIEGKLTGNSQVDKEIYCGILDKPGRGNVLTRVIYFKTKMGIFGVHNTYHPSTDISDSNKTNDWDWYISLPRGENASSVMELMCSIDRESFLGTSEYVIGNHLPEPGSIAPIKNIIHRVDEWLAKQKK
jgi:hypothetical protein